MADFSRNAALIPIDVQRAFDDPSWGERNNPAMETNGQTLLAAWRHSGRQIIHVKHNSVLPRSTLRPCQPGNAFKPGFEPQDKEPLIEKTVNSAFIGTGLKVLLDAASIRQLVFFGLTSDMCVSTSVRMAANLGYETFMVGDACAAFGQTAPDGAAIDAETIHRAHLTTLNSEFAQVLNTDEIIARLHYYAAA